MPLSIVSKLPPELQKAQKKYESSKKGPGFMTPGDPPVCPEIWKDLNFRERVQVHHEAMASVQGNEFPFVVYAFYILKMATYCGVFYRYLLDENGWFTKNNFLRFLIYNIVQDATGFGATNGALGFRNGIPFTAWYNFVTPGTVCSPLFGNNGKRGILPVALYCAYIVALMRCLVFVDVIQQMDIVLILVPLAIITFFDVTIFLASRGEHYIYMLFCCLFSNWLTGCQIVQVALWTWAGIAKLGPWFAYCITQMMPNTPLLRMVYILPYILKDGNPTLIGKIIALFGKATECVMGFVCLFSLTRYLGVFTTCGFHCFIISMMPFASVFEWNFFCIFLSLFLFGSNNFQISRDITPLSYSMFAFLFTVCFVIPLIGQIKPDLVPFLLAYRPYTGNWHFTWLIFPEREQVTKKLKTLKTLDSPVVQDDLEKIFGKELAPYYKYFLHAQLTHYPNFRGIIPVCEQLIKDNKWKVPELHLEMQLEWTNPILGWCLGNGWLVQKSTMQAMQEICKFEKQQCYILRVHALGLFERNVRWSLTDLADIDNPQTWTDSFENLSSCTACGYEINSKKTD